MSPGPKKWLESCVSRFSTICAKNQVLKLKIDKVTVIRVTKCPFWATLPCTTAVYWCCTCSTRVYTAVDLQGRRARKGQLKSRITVTLSIFKFSTWFFAQIVENRETQLSSPFLGPGDNFSKSYDENQIWTKCAYARAGLMRRSQMPYKCHTNLFSS